MRFRVPFRRRPARAPRLPSWPAPLLALALVLPLAGCGGDAAVPEPPRPVLVERPDAHAREAYGAYAGEVRARQESTLSFRIAGNLVRRLVDAGDRVRRDQVLAELDPGDQRLQAQSAQAQYAASAAELVRARADRARYAQLAEDRLVSRSAFDAQEAAFRAAQGQARAAQAQLDVARNQTGYTRLRAPRDGVIASRQAEAGQVVAAGQTVFTLAADGGREIAIALPEARIAAFRVGQPALVELWNRPGVRLPGTIREIAAAADPQTRTYAARVALADDAVGSVELGQSARVYLQDAAVASALSVPLAAIQRGADGAGMVWCVDPASGRLRAARVRLGPFGDERVPVLAGLRAGDWVVVAGGHLLRAGQRVQPVDRDNRPLRLTARAPSQG